MSLIGIGSASGQTKRVMTSRLGSVIIRVGIGCSLQGTCGSRRTLFPRNHRPAYKVAAGPPSLTLTVTLRRPQRGRLEGSTATSRAVHPSRLAPLAPQDDGPASGAYLQRASATHSSIVARLTGKSIHQHYRATVCGRAAGHDPPARRTEKGE